MSEHFVTALTATGALFSAYYTYQLSRFIHLHCIHRSTLNHYHHVGSKSNHWAVVTGASDGIGRGFAEELLTQGFNVIIHGRNPTKLEKVKEELLRQHPDREVRIAVLDAVKAARDHCEIEKLVSEWRAGGLNITVLINNVGGAGNVKKIWVPLHERCGPELDTFLDVNSSFPTHFTRAMLPLLFENKPGLIINVGSVTAHLPSPYLAAYAGSKAYVLSWSRSLRAEMKAQGKDQDIEVLGLAVGPVKAQHDQREPSFFEPSSRNMAKAALGVVGCGSADVTAYWPHALQMFVLGLMPGWVVEGLMVRIARGRREEEGKGKLSSR